MASPSLAARAAILGVPYQAGKRPDPLGVVKAFEALDAKAMATSAGAIVRDTLVSLNAVSNPPAHQMGWVTGDATAANNGIYENAGSPSAPDWQRRADLPFGVIHMINAGAGTPDAIVATSSLPAPTAPGAALFTINIVADSTGPVTINGKPVRTNSGNEIVPGGLTAPSMPVFVDLGDHYRLLSDQASASIIAAAEGWAVQAGERADDAENAADRAEGFAAMQSADKVNFKTVPLLLADTLMSYDDEPGKIHVGPGDEFSAAGFRYEVVAAEADYDISTASGVRAIALPNQDGTFNRAAFPSLLSAINRAQGRPVIMMEDEVLADPIATSTDINIVAERDIEITAGWDTHEAQMLRARGSYHAERVTWNADGRALKCIVAGDSDETRGHFRSWRCRYINALQKEIGASAGGIQFAGTYAVFDWVDSEIDNINSEVPLGTGTEDRPTTRGIEWLQGRACISGHMQGGSITNIAAGDNWGELQIDADGLVWRNGNFGRRLDVTGLTIGNCAKRWVKGNRPGHGLYMDKCIFFSEEDRPCLTGIDAQGSSGWVRNSSYRFTGDNSIPRHAIGGISFAGDSIGDDGFIFDGMDIIARDVNNQAPPLLAVYPSIISLQEGGPTRNCGLRRVRFSAENSNVSFVAAVTSRLTAVTPQNDAILTGVIDFEISDSDFRQTAISSLIMAARSGSGFTYQSFVTSGNLMPPGVDGRSVVNDQTNLTTVFSEVGNVHTGPAGSYLSPRPDALDIQTAPDSFGLFSGTLQRLTRQTVVGTVATTIMNMVASPEGGEVTVYGRRTTSAGGGNVFFVDKLLVLITATGEFELLGAVERGSPAARTYSISGANLQLAMDSGSYIVTAVAETLEGVNPDQ